MEGTTVSGVIFNDQIWHMLAPLLRICGDFTAVFFVPWQQGVLDEAQGNDTPGTPGAQLGSHGRIRNGSSLRACHRNETTLNSSSKIVKKL